MELNKYIDHTILKAAATVEEIKTLCAEAKEYKFFSVCVNPAYAELAKKELEGSGVKVCCVIGFPLGANTTDVKVFEAKDAVAKGAEEIDMVINIGYMKSGMYDEVYQEIKAIKEALGDTLLKVIFETCYLTDEEKREACRLSVKAGAEYVKTSTGFGTGGATYEDVGLMLSEVAGRAKVKASGGVRDKETAAKYISMGVERLGTSSGIKILQGEKVVGGY